MWLWKERTWIIYNILYIFIYYFYTLIILFFCFNTVHFRLHWRILSSKTWRKIATGHSWWHFFIRGHFTQGEWNGWIAYAVSELIIAILFRYSWLFWYFNIIISDYMQLEIFVQYQYTHSWYLDFIHLSR